MLSRSPPGQLFPRFPVSPACCLAPSQQSSPQDICMVSHPSSMLPAKLSASYFQGFLSVHHAVSLPSLPVKPSESYLHGFLFAHHAVSQPPSEALRKLFGRFPVRPACCLAPSQQSSPQAICAVSCPSSILSRSLPSMLSASCLHGSLAPSQRNSPPSFLHGVSSVQHAVSLPPSEAFGKLTAQFPVRPACCLAPSHKKFTASYFHGLLYPSSMLSRSPPSEALRKQTARFPVRPAYCLAPFHKKLSAAICTVSYPSSMLSRFLPAKLSASYLHGFLPIQHAVSLLPSQALCKLFPRFRIRPACCLAPSQQNSPQAICGVSYPSSILSRSPPAKLSASYLRRFLSVQHPVSLPPIDAFRQLFARLFRSSPAELSAQLFARCLIRPACCLAPSQRSFRQANRTVPCPSSMLSRSLPQKIHRKLFPRFAISAQHAISLPPSEALRKQTARFPVRPAYCLAPFHKKLSAAICTVSYPSSMLSCCLAFSQQSSPRAICTVSCPSSTPSRSFPAKLSASCFHGFVSVQHAVSLPASRTLRKLFAAFPIRLAPSQQSSPRAKRTVSYPWQHAVALLPSGALRTLFARCPIRPACCLAPSQQSFPQAICTVPCPSSMLSRSVPPKLSASYFHDSYRSSHWYFGASILRSTCFAKGFRKISLWNGRPEDVQHYD